MSDKRSISKIIEARYKDAVQNLESLPLGHPMEASKIAYAKALKDLEFDLRKEKLWDSGEKINLYPGC
jgi:hypothetical protein